MVYYHLELNLYETIYFWNRVKTAKVLKVLQKPPKNLNDSTAVTLNPFSPEETPNIKEREETNSTPTPLCTRVRKTFKNAPEVSY